MSKCAGLYYLNADLLDGTSLDGIPAYVATNLAANAVSGDKISGGTIDSTTITNGFLPTTVNQPGFLSQFPKPEYKQA